MASLMESRMEGPTRIARVMGVARLIRIHASSVTERRPPVSTASPSCRRAHTAPRQGQRTAGLRIETPTTSGLRNTAARVVATVAAIVPHTGMVRCVLLVADASSATELATAATSRH